MLLLLLAYLGGVLTIVSPCILPVLPFVFSRAQAPFLRSGLPLLVGMALTFALVASLAAVGGGWVVAANQYGRWAALALVALFGATLLWPRVADRLTRPLVALGSRLSESASGEARPSVGASFVLGVATGLLWAPCAGPILGLILTGAALQGASLSSSLLLLAYAAGAATSMGAALLLGAKVFAGMKRSIGAGEGIRKVLGAAMLAGVAAIALGLDTGALANLSVASTGGLEQRLLAKLGGEARTNSERAALTVTRTNGEDPRLPDLGIAPPLDGATQWLNGNRPSNASLSGKVVLVDFWTYSCINCLRTLPYVKAWAKKYGPQGLVVVGVHAPEFAFERDVDNVRKALKDLGIDYVVAVDNDFAIWRAYRNQYWPAHYFIDSKGHIRHQHFGEGDHAESEHVIQQLLRESGVSVAGGVAEVPAQGVQAAADEGALHSSETYIGYERASNFASRPAAARDTATEYALPRNLGLNDWGLAGRWTVGRERAVLDSSGGRIVYRFHSRDLHLVLGPSGDGQPVRFRVLIDGKEPGDAQGSDVSADGTGVVTEQRLYQLVRQTGQIADRTFSIEFLDSGATAYVFTFG